MQKEVESRMRQVLSYQYYLCARGQKMTPSKSNQNKRGREGPSVEQKRQRPRKVPGD